MKKYSIISLALLLVLSINLSIVGAAPSDFVGTWTLNRAKSHGLTGGLSDAEVLLVVKLEENNILSVDQKIKIRDREQPSQPLDYSLDGKETTAEVVRPMAGTMHLRARVSNKGQSIELQSKISGEDQGSDVTITTRETWDLVDGGRGLIVTRLRETPGKTQQFKLYFEKQ